MASESKRKSPEPRPRRCCICGGGPAEGLGDMVTYRGCHPCNPGGNGGRVAHRLCVPAFLRRVKPAAFRAEVPSGADMN